MMNRLADIDASILGMDFQRAREIAREYRELADFSAGEGSLEVAANLRRWASLYENFAEVAHEAQKIGLRSSVG